MIQHQTVPVDTSKVSLTAGVADKSGNNYELGRSVLLTNAGTSSAFIGGATVTTSDYGYELKPGGELSLDLLASDEVWAVASVATSIRVLTLGV